MARQSWNKPVLSTSFTDTETSADFYRRVFSESPVAIVVTDPMFLIIDANACAEKLLNRLRSQLQEKPFLLMVAAKERRAFGAITADIMASRESISRPILLAPQGAEPVDARMRATAIRDQKGNIESFILVLESRTNEIDPFLL
jgi:hypothetical protein